jgi:pyruvate/2-oxoglutarate dehydrogenase complex dihydrolipoamide dehydrogenase (E3) component
LRLVHGRASFVAPHEVQVGAERFEAPTIVLNVGALPAVPKVPGLSSVRFFDNASIMALHERPSHLVVLGGGYIGCELGQMLRRCGADVTILDHNEHLLSREDPEISSALEDVFRTEGIAMHLSVQIESVAEESGGISVRLAGGDVVRGSHLLVATGRRANIDDLGLEAAGVKVHARGYILADDGYETNVPGVFAVGDATGEPQFTHTSWDDHRILLGRLLGRSTRGRSGRVVPYVVFTDPQIAGVGITEREARAKGVKYEAASMPYSEIARALEVDERAGLLKALISAEPDGDKLLGCRIMGAEAGEQIHVAALLIFAGVSPRAVVDMEVVHPTFSEGFQSLLMSFARYA